MGELNIYTDGGARGNPGPAAIGVHLIAEGFEFLHGRCIDSATNNVAEYSAVIDAVSVLRDLMEQGEIAPTKLLFHLDSELVVKQLRGEYRVKDLNLQVLHRQAIAELTALGLPYTITHVPRAQNKIADQLVNAALDNTLSALITR